MKYDFDKEISRQHTHSTKWELMQTGEDMRDTVPTDAYYGQNRKLPMWVADMDFQSPQPVIDALVERAKHGIFGYANAGESYYNAIINWMKKRHGWRIEKDWICTTPGVVPAVYMLIRAFTVPGQKVLIQPPVYYPFFDAIKKNGVGICRNPLVLEDGRYRMDFEDLEQKTQDPSVKMAVLCSPHNPIGRVWTPEELRRFGEICYRNDVLVVSDEIHGDLIYSGNRFTPFATVSHDFNQRAISCSAPSKTFNVPGLKTSNVIIANPKMRRQFEATLEVNAMYGLNVFGATALEAAYNHGEEWLDQLLVYVEGNLDYLASFVDQHLPELQVIQPEGTYLAWLDCRKLGLDRHALHKLLFDEANIHLDEGFLFGHEGEGFERINLACPRSILVEALDRIERAVRGLRITA